MIITKTPYRISFFGGGSDYPEWFNEHHGEVISSTINKYLYISCRELPHFFKHKFRVVYSKIENVKKINDINHNGVKQLLLHSKIKDGLEIHYDGDLPSRSGMGSSSCFVVGLSKVLFDLLKIKKNKHQLTNFAINFEHNILKEIVGSQDQTATIYGGFNRINFKKNKIQVKKIKNKNNLNKLNKNLMLIYTGIQRNAPDIAKRYVNTLTIRNKECIKKLIGHVDEGERIINNGSIDDFGDLLDEAWHYKKEISRNISNSKIDNIYEEAKKNGALGGKLLGAGGGGFMLFYMKDHKRKDFLKKNSKLLNIPFNFSEEGSEVIFNHTK